MDFIIHLNTAHDVHVSNKSDNLILCCHNSITKHQVNIKTKSETPSAKIQNTYLVPRPTPGNPYVDL